jgi:hypothetical protein
MFATIQQWIPAAVTLAVGWLMVRTGTSNLVLFLRTPARCAFCGRLRGRGCDCTERMQ